MKPKYLMLCRLVYFNATLV